MLVETIACIHYLMLITAMRCVKHYMQHTTTHLFSSTPGLCCSSRDKLNSAKKMRKAALRDRNKVKEADLQDDPAAMRQLFDKAIAEREVANDPSKEELLRRAHERRIIPQHHLDATKPFDAYRSALHCLATAVTIKMLLTDILNIDNIKNDDPSKQKLLRRAHERQP